MGGGLIQLVAQGFEDLYLTNEPEITFFKKIYKRHTNFSLELIPQLFNTTPDFGKRVTCNISKNADLLSNIYLYVELPILPRIYDDNNDLHKINKFAWAKKIGYAIINYIELEIGGQLIDKHYGDWLNIWSELTETSCETGINKMIGNIKENYSFTNGKNNYKLYIPLKFWFCRHKGLALPLVALHFCDVKIHIEFNNLEDILLTSPTHYIEVDNNIVHFKENEIIYQKIGNKRIEVIFSNFDYETNRLYYLKYNEPLQSYNSSVGYQKDNFKIYNNKGFFVTPKDNAIESNYNIEYPYVSLNTSYLLINYIFLDNQERERFSKSKHEYLIDFIQYNGEKVVYNSHQKFRLGFTQPSKEIIWTSQIKSLKSGFIKDRFNYTDRIENGVSLIKNSRLLLNGQERTSNRDFYYYNYINPYKYHSSTPNNGVNMYSFSSKPENEQPTGSCNFSKIDDIVLELDIDKSISYSNPATVKVYNNAYNIFRIINGLGSIAFSS